MRKYLYLLTATVLLSAQLAAQPTQQWSSLVYDIDNMKSITTDHEGNSFVCGDLDNGAFGWDIVTIKYSVDGDTLWKRRFDSDVHSNDYATKLLTDDDGNCYVYGRSQNGFDFHPVLIKYAPSGTELFKIVYVEFIIVSASDMEIDDAIYISMGYSGSILAKINFDGDTVWTRSYAIGGTESALTNRIAISDADKILATGEYLGDFTGTYYDVLNQVCNTDGSGFDQFLYNGLLSDEDRGIDIVPGDDPVMYVAGYSLDTPSASPSYNMIVMKFTTGGDLIWESHFDYDPDFNYNDYPLEILRNEEGTLLVLANSSYLTTERFEIVAVNDDGGIDWVNDLVLPGYIWDMHLYMDGVVISEVEEGISSIKYYNNDGETGFEIELDDASGMNLITVDDEESIFVVYGVTTPFPNTYFAKYADTSDVGIDHILNEMLIAYPNPCDQQITIQTNQFGAQPVYEVHDLNGRLIQRGIIPGGSCCFNLATNLMKSGIYRVVIIDERQTDYTMITVQH